MTLTSQTDNRGVMFLQTQHKFCLYVAVQSIVICLLVFLSMAHAQEVKVTAVTEDTLADDEEELIEHIAVTGTRLKGIDAQISSPISFISREDIEESGAGRLVDLLQMANVSIHGARRESPGGAAQGQATVNLRGLGEQRTLVLINGRRIANSAAIPDAQNINLIPLSSIERIEILKDGASSIYGADAIGGVVNIILRKQPYSNSIHVSYLQPQIDGGTQQSIALNGGFSNDDLQITYSVEHQKKSAIYARDVELTEEGLNEYGFPGSYRIKTFHPTTREPLITEVADDRCPAQLNQSPFPNSKLEGGLCKYNFAQFMQLLPESDSSALLLDTDWQLSDVTSLNLNLSYTQNDSIGVFAATPSAGGKNFLPFMSATNVNNPTNGELVGFDSDFDGVNDTFIEGPFDIELYYRNVLGGERVTENTDKMLNLSATLSGELSENQFYQVYAFYNNNRTDSLSEGLVRRTLLQGAIDSGQFDVFAVNNPTSAILAKSFLVNSLFSALFENKGLSFTMDTALFSDPESGSDTVFGVEYVQHSYRSEYDDLYADEIVDGRGGVGDTKGERDIWSMFAETSFDVTKALNLNLALRYDYYSDLGSSLTPKLGLTYRYTPNLVFRASVGTGFRVPSLSELYQLDTQTFDFVRDYQRCNASGDMNNDGVADQHQDTQELGHNHPCQPLNVEITTQGNTSLEAEKSISFTTGFSYENDEKSRFDFNLYYQAYDNEITILSADEILEREPKYQPFNNVIRDNDGQLLRVIERYDNLSGTKTLGIDIEHEYLWDKLSFGSIKWETNISASIFHKVEFFPGDGFTDVSGDFGKNEGTIYTAFTWKNEGWKGKVGFTYMPSTEEFDTKLSSFLVTNLHLQKTFYEKHKFTLGVMNLLDAKPPSNGAFGWPYYLVDDLYIQGRTLHLSYSFTL